MSYISICALAQLLCHISCTSGSSNNQIKLINIKVKSFQDIQPTFSSPDIDWAILNRILCKLEPFKVVI